MQLADHSFLKRFPEPLARELHAAAQEQEYADGHVIFKEADTGDAVYLVLAGLVELSKGGETGAPVLALVKPDGYFGEIGILTDAGRIARSVCRGERTRLARIPREVFLSVVYRSPVQSVIDLFGKLGENLREMDERYVRDVLRKERMSLIGETANKVIHDLKAPFTAISMGVEMVQRLHGDAQTSRLCRVMDRNLALMQQMMQEILDFTSGQPQLRRRQVDLASILRDLVEDNEQWLADQKVGIQIEGAEVLLDVDPGRIRRALQNLVVNSVDAFQRGIGDTIFIRARRVGSQAELQFEDNGPGLPGHMGASVFDPFVSAGKKGGTGLGLSIAKGIIEAHGGSISLCARREGTGACFRMRLPLSIS